MANGGEAQIEKGAVILAYSERPPLAGLIVTWLKVSTRTAGGREHSDFFILYLQEFEVPSVGSVCDIKYRIKNIEGLVGGSIGPGTNKIENAKVIEELACSGRTFAFR